jgi:amidase
MKKYLTAIILMAGFGRVSAVFAQPSTGAVFHPTTFFHSFQADSPAMLTIRPGEIVETETVDAAGFDKEGRKRTRGGNPLTGPFVVEGAAVGDVLAIRLLSVSLNRDFAFTTEYFANRSMPKEIVKNFRKARRIRWGIDRDRGMTWPDSPSGAYPRLSGFRIPVAPMLGCIGVAPAGRGVLSFFQGPWGGNLDFSRIRTGATVYLPVFREGAYLYIGDGHALEGDGEIAGNALETSMDVRISVEVLKTDSKADSLPLTDPRVEDEEYIMALGTDKDLGEAVKKASKNLLDWLRRDYRLGLDEATQVMSTTIEYSIAEIADPNVVAVARIRKKLLQGLK